MGAKIRFDRGKDWKLCWITVPTPSTEKGLVVTDELIHHTDHSADSCHCRSSTPTPQLHSSDCMCEHTPGKGLPLLTWKHNRAHTLTHAPRVDTSKVSHLSGCAYLWLWLQLMRVPSQTEVFLRAKSP